MQKFIFTTLTLCVLLAVALAGLIADLSHEDKYQMAVEHQKPLHEIVHVHHVPVQIPVYASMVVHEPHYQPHPQQQQHQQHHNTNSHVSVGKYPFYEKERKSESQSCSAPDGAGFRRLFHEASDLLPKKEIAAIVRNAKKYDPEVRAFRQILFSQKTLDKLLTVRASMEFNQLADYACKRVFLNLRNLLKFISCFIASEEPEISTASTNYEQTEDEFKGRPGLRGMIKDIYDILPREQLRQLYQRLKESDRYLAYSVRGLKDPEFQVLMKNLYEVPDYKELKKMLVEAGLPVEEYNKLLAATIGWQGDAPEDVLKF